MDISGSDSDRLRAVFTICDPDKKGFITVEHFVNLARNHFGAGVGHQDNEDMRRIVQVLDPEGDGKIHFDEFCQGVREILELKSPGSPQMNMSCPGLFPATRPHALGSEFTLSTQEDTASSGTQDTSELSTFNEYDTSTDDDQTPVVARSSGTFLSDIIMSQTSPCNDQEPRPEIEGIDASSIGYHDDTGQSNTDTGSHMFYKPKHLHDDIRSHRRVTSSGLASHLYRYNTGRRSSYGSDEIFDDIDGNFFELNDKVKKLEAQIKYLTDTRQSNDQKRTKLKEENCSLVESRVHLLEEQVRDVEHKSEERLAEEERKYKDILVRADKDKTMEIEILSQSLKHMEDEYEALKEEAPRLRLENERCKKENQNVEHQLYEAHQQLSALTLEHADLQQRHHDVNAEYEQERQVRSQLIDELTRELDELRTKMENNGTMPSAHSTAYDLKHSQRKELEATITRLKEENVRLLEEKEELLLSNHIQEGRSLVQGGLSLAEEIDKLPRDELLQTVREQQYENETLRQYIERMTLRIIEKNPSILEIPINLKKK